VQSKNLVLDRVQKDSRLVEVLRMIKIEQSEVSESKPGASTTEIADESLRPNW